MLIYSHNVRVTPMGKPRMTQRDRWKKRPVVLRYHAFCDEVRLQVGRRMARPERLRITAWFPMPKSWSKKKRMQHVGHYHRQKPDADNIGKAVMDALWEDDSVIADLQVIKRWSGMTDTTGRMEIEFE